MLWFGKKDEKAAVEMMMEYMTEVKETIDYDGRTYAPREMEMDVSVWKDPKDKNAYELYLKASEGSIACTARYKINVKEKKVKKVTATLKASVSSKKNKKPKE